jgi:flavodoxin
MQALVMYESMFGNSEQVARAIAAGLTGFSGVEVRDVAHHSARDMGPDVDLLVVGGPTHALSMSRANTREDAIRQGAGQGLTSRGLREWLDGLPDQLDQLPVATFDTRVSRVRRLPGSAARSAARMLRRRGGRLVLAPESFYVGDVSGPLREGEPERARAWGRQIGAVAAQAHAYTEAN